MGNASSVKYDLNGNLIQSTDRKGQVTTIAYDGLNRPTGTQFNDGSTIANTYDAGSRLTAITDSLSGTISRSYDGFNDLLSETTPQGSVSYTYDADRRRQTMTVSGQSQVSYIVDNDSRLTSITQGSSTVGFSYDADSRRTSLTLPNGITATYSYDQASQLTGMVYQGGALAPANLEYTYDLAGRRTSVSGSLASEQLPTAVSGATYNADNQLTQWGAAAMTYDANGNTLSDGTNSYVWDARNRLVSADSGGAAFSYDALGRRISKTLLSTATGFLYDGANAVQEQSGGNVTANMLDGGVDEHFERTDATGSYSYLTDALGSTEALTDASGNSDVQYSYGPYGSLSISGSTTNSYGYTGRESDGLGIYYYRARYYSPTTGRFLSEDPTGFAGGINEYAYVDDDPLNFVDRFGLATTVIVWNPVGMGESSQGHASIIINGTSYSFGPGGMSIMPADQYLARNESFRNGFGDNLNLTPDQEQRLANYLTNYKKPYNLLVGRNCTTPIRDGLWSVGVDVPIPLDWTSIIPFPLEWVPSDLQWAVENTPGLVSGWTGYFNH